MNAIITELWLFLLIIFTPQSIFSVHIGNDANIMILDFLQNITKSITKIKGLFYSVGELFS